MLIFAKIKKNTKLVVGELEYKSFIGLEKINSNFL